MRNNCAHILTNETAADILSSAVLFFETVLRVNKINFENLCARVEKTRAAHSIFEVFKLHKTMIEITNIEPTKTTTHEIILNNNFGTPQSEKVFQYLISVCKNTIRDQLMTP